MVLLLHKARPLALVARFIHQIFPLVNLELDHWLHHIDCITDTRLASQALASVQGKKFHCQGGSIYSIYPGVDTGGFVRLVVALQTISDYLDNLCDRAGVSDEAAFCQLHRAMTDALDPDREIHDYYACYPFKNDSGYLASLVAACREEVARLPAYEVVKPLTLQLTGLYSDLQTLKHLDVPIREQKIFGWSEQNLSGYPELTPWEFAAASGSTLGVFMLCAMAANPALTVETAQQVLSAYFPWICGLHILLDYFIDQAEDQTNGDLNFVAFYKDEQETLDRLTYFCRHAYFLARELPHSPFNETVVQGLLAMYLSDPKVDASERLPVKSALLATTGGYTRLFYTLCRLLRKRQML